MGYKKYLLTMITSILLISLISAYPIYVKPLDGSGNVQPNTDFNYTFNFTINNDCSGVLLSNTSTISTGNDGIGFIDINISDLSITPNYYCEYRNDSLRLVKQFSDNIFNVLYVDEIISSGNITTSGWVNGRFNWTTDNWNNFDGSLLTFNESKLTTKYYNKTEINDTFWKSDGTSTATGNWDIGSYNITATSFIGDGSQLTGIDSGWTGTATSDLNMSGYSIGNVSDLLVNKTITSNIEPQDNTSIISFHPDAYGYGEPRIEFFKNADAENYNPTLRFYGHATNRGDKRYTDIYIDNWGRLVWDGTFTSLTVNKKFSIGGYVSETSYDDKNAFMLGARDGYIGLNAKSGPGQYVTLFGTDRNRAGPTNWWLMADWQEATWDFNLPSTDQNHLGIHAGNGSAIDKIIYLTHDATDGEIGTLSGDINLKPNSSKVKVDGNIHAGYFIGDGSLLSNVNYTE
ncbi:MAG: hypothetical protein ACP5D2_03605, partial [Candidatus Nanoarchaeia archaeon]